MFTMTCWASDVFGLKAVHRFPTGCCKSHNVKNWMVGCTDRKDGALHSKEWTSQKLTYGEYAQCSFEDSSSVQLKIELETLPLSRMSTHVVIQPVCAWSLRKWITSRSFTVDCSPLANEKLTRTWLLGKPDVITLRMLLASLYKAINGKNEIPLLWCNLNQVWHKSDENINLHIHKVRLVGHHDHNWERQNLPWWRNRMRSDAVCTSARYRMRWKHCSQLGECSKTKTCSNRQSTGTSGDKNRSTNASASTSSCPCFRNKQMAEKTEPVDLVRLSVLRNDVWMLALGFGQFLKGSKIRPIVPITLGVISIIIHSRIHNHNLTSLICPICVIVITPAFFGMGLFLVFLALVVEMHLMLMIGLHLLVEVVTWMDFLLFLLHLLFLLNFPFHEGIPLKESLPFIPFLPFLPFPLPFSPESRVLLVIFICCKNLFLLTSGGSRVLIFFL